MGLPFTAEQFFRFFADYNRAFIVAVVALWVASLLGIRQRRHSACRVRQIS